MNTQRRVLITIIVLFVLIVGLFLFSDWFSKTTGYFLGEDKKTRFIMCLNEKGAILYTTDYDECVECYRQDEMLGNTELIEKFECRGNCENLREIPAWEIDGKFYYGKKSFMELEEISGCVID